MQAATIEEIDDSHKPINQVKGIPNFWLTAMQNHPMISPLITEADDPALSKLSNITLTYTDDNLGFILGFVFDDNEYFTNKVLTKTYYLQNNVGSEYEDLIYSKSEGCTIDWKPNKNLTVRIETKKQRHKNSKKTRVVKREVPTDSFFRFFSPPKMPTRNEGEEEDEEEEEEQDPALEDAIEQDFELGEVFKTRIVKHAVDWFTGKALQHYDDYEDEDYDGEDDDEGGEGNDDDEDDEDEDAPPAASAAAKPGEKAECQQQ